MDPVILSRLQFALTTIYHWLFVPLTLGLGWFVAFMQTRDEILVIDEGRIVERGTHQELLRQAGLYRHLWDLQNQVLEEVESNKRFIFPLGRVNIACIGYSNML